MKREAVLSLYIGPAVPLAVSPEVIDALVSCRVTASTEGPSVFQLVFELAKSSPLHTLFLVSAGAPIPMVRVVIAAKVNGIEQVLIDGVMTNHEVSPGPTSGTARLTVTGEDLTRVLDYVDFSFIRYPAMPDFARVALILAKYAFLGIIPKVLPSVLIDVPIPTEKIPAHQGKDLGYIKMLAERVGYVFYIEPTAKVGVTEAYWGPEIRTGPAEPALNDDMDAHRNVESLTGSFDSQAGKISLVYVQNPQTKLPIPIPIPDVTPLNPPLGVVPPVPLRIEPITETAKYNPIQGALIGLAKVARSAANAVRVEGTLDVRTYGRLLRPRRLVGVRGAGAAFNGLHYVESVTTTLSEGSLKQQFRLGRGGLLPTVAEVTP